MLYIYIYIYIYTYILYIYIYTYILYIYIYISIFVYICIYTYIYVYTIMYKREHRGSVCKTSECWTITYQMSLTFNSACSFHIAATTGVTVEHR